MKILIPTSPVSAISDIGACFRPAPCSDLIPSPSCLPPPPPRRYEIMSPIGHGINVKSNLGFANRMRSCRNYPSEIKTDYRSWQTCVLRTSSRYFITMKRIKPRWQQPFLAFSAKILDVRTDRKYGRRVEAEEEAEVLEIMKLSPLTARRQASRLFARVSVHKRVRATLEYLERERIDLASHNEANDCDLISARFVIPVHLAWNRLPHCRSK